MGGRRSSGRPSIRTFPRVCRVGVIGGSSRGSRSRIRVVIKLADDAGQSGLGLAEVIAAVAVAAKTPALAQFVDRAGDFAAVLAAERFDDIGVEHRTRAERLLDGLIARRA